MSEHAPLVLRRIIELRRFPILADVELRELAVVAENVRPVTFATGDLVAAPNTRIDSIQLVLDGKLVSCAPDRVWSPHEAFGVLELLAEREIAGPVVAACETKVLQLRAFQVEDILEDNFGILSASLRRFAAELARERSRQRMRERPPQASPLGLVERLIVLRQLMPFADARLRTLALIAHGARDTAWSPGQRLSSQDEVADEFHVVIDGTMRAIRDGRVVRELEPGDAFGMFETLANAPYELSIEATSSARTSSYSATAIFDAIEDHADAGIGMLRACARALLDRGDRTTRDADSFTAGWAA